ncbi:carboxylesterase 3 isoform X1 [Hypomesus transpacificus]|uniref:carboxylesterase 3 isoform X1 n=1 Tax=Hypomesus transpacificus TaxID=137520 RepID=UPI001F0886DA|nr:carboxylesterase 3 isoform X1 [Hypomesus transpacificus]
MRTLFLLLCLACAFLQTTLGAPAEPGTVVSLKDGKVRGAYATVKGTDRRVQQYLGIPFARPPVGPLRLAAPQPPESWDGERDSTLQPPMCIQDKAVGLQVSQTMSIEYTLPAISEDCLYLNVYTPTDSASEKLPVFVWIHGGGLSMGAASQFDGAPLAAYENIVVVVIQYRLGILGYLSTGDEHARGNWGFLDQVAALQWVQENIHQFGGDPQSVTIAGESAGGISASTLTLSPLTKGLFHRVVFQSGVATLGPYTTNVPLVQAKTIANLMECDHPDTQQLVSCLREKTEEQLVNVTKKMKIYLGAVVDGVFLTDLPEELLKKKEVMKVPVLIGVTNHEFGWILPRAFAPPGWDTGMDRESVMAMLALFNPQGVSGANQLLADEYLKDAKTPEEIRDGFTHMLGDVFMVLPVIKVAGYHRDAGAPVYMYEFQHRPEAHKLTRPAFVKSDHADEVGFMFGACFWNGHIKITGTITQEEEKLCKTMMSYWANFARTGSPNGAGLLQWPLFGQDQEFMELDLTPSVSQNIRKEQILFMTVTLPKKLATAASPGR